MAEISNQSTRNRSPGKGKRKRKSTRIDMTAMVDVAFLLLTFFVLTATLQQANVMELVVPPSCESEDCNVNVKEGKVLTLVLEKEGLTYYLGNEVSNLKTTDYSSSSIRHVLFSHLNRHNNRCEDKVDGSCWDPIFVVKPKNDCKYKQLVNLLDEIAIVEAEKFAISPFSEADSLMLAQAKL